MRGARVTEVAQRPNSRIPANLRASGSNSDQVHSRSRTDKSSKLAETQPGRGFHSGNPPNQRKLGTRIADLESQLGLAQEELKCLKDQLSSTEVAKKAAAHDQLEKKPKKQLEDSAVYEETDVFEVPMEESAVERKEDDEDDGFTPKSRDDLERKLEEKDRELDVIRLENECLTAHLAEKSAKISSALSEVEELKSRLREAEQELENSRSNASQMMKRMEAAERDKEEMGSEMRRLAVQTEQWRKAADAAAAILAGGGDVNCHRLSQRCGSLDTHYATSLGFSGFEGSPAMIDDDPLDVFSEKRKGSGSGIRLLGDLLKKKSQK